MGMAFEMQVVSHAPLTGEDDPQRLAKLLFSMIGYTARKGPDHGVSFRLFYNCFLLHPTKEWTIEELAVACETTLPSVYRHLNKLKDLDIIEDLYVGGEDPDGGEGGDDGAGEDENRSSASSKGPSTRPLSTKIPAKAQDRKRAFRLRYGDLSKAWNFVEAHFRLASENYRRSVDHLETLLRQARGPAPPSR